MSLSSIEDIKEFAAGLRPYAPPLRASERHNLEILGLMCGLSKDGARSASEADLCALNITVRKKPDSGYQVAQRIDRKMGFGGNPLDAFAMPPAKPVEAPGAPSGGVTLEEVRAMIEKVARTVGAEFRLYADGVDERVMWALRDEYQADAAELRTDLAGAIRETTENLAKDIDGAARIAVGEALKAMTPTVLEITKPDATPVPLGLVHYATPEIIKALAANLNVYLHGPAGSGKTTVARKCAEAFGLAFYTAAKVESEYLLLGFKDAQGNTVRTQFREAYEHGGVFLFDELDASSPGAVVAMNMALANGVCPFPDGNVPRHASFKCIAAGNTVLSGATHQYAGRNQLDAASVDRFFFIEFGYDEQLEMALASNRDWCVYVQYVRKAVKDRGLRHLVTPRATLDGCTALAAGFTWEQAEMACVYKGLDKDTIDQIKLAVVRLQNAA